MKRRKELAESIREFQAEDQLDVFIGGHSVTFEIMVDDQGVYLTVGPHCVGECGQPGDWRRGVERAAGLRSALTCRLAAAARFLNEVDSAIVLHNASTEFADRRVWYARENGHTHRPRPCPRTRWSEQLASFKRRMPRWCSSPLSWMGATCRLRSQG